MLPLSQQVFRKTLYPATNGTLLLRSLAQCYARKVYEMSALPCAFAAAKCMTSISCSAAVTADAKAGGLQEMEKGKDFFHIVAWQQYALAADGGNWTACEQDEVCRVWLECMSCL